MTGTREAPTIRAPRGRELTCKGWHQEAALRMLMNNLDPEVAERPEDLVVYGGTSCTTPLRLRLRTLALALPARAWRRVTWRNGTNRPWAARFAAVRVTPAHDRRDRRLAPEIWLLCEQDLGATPRTKYFFVDLPATASVKQLVRLAHQRWAIEQQYQELKTELGFDHFEGRSYPGGSITSCSPPSCTRSYSGSGCGAASAPR